MSQKGHLGLKGQGHKLFFFHADESTWAKEYSLIPKYKCCTMYRSSYRLYCTDLQKLWSFNMGGGSTNKKIVLTAGWWKNSWN